MKNVFAEGMRSGVHPSSRPCKREAIALAFSADGSTFSSRFFGHQQKETIRLRWDRMLPAFVTSGFEEGFIPLR